MTKTAIITGASSGIGEAAVRAFAAAGWRVIATGRRRSQVMTSRRACSGLPSCRRMSTSTGWS
jgi:NAD(P)-dependent dehydrogenase (short-subunit alcohol dehydrogenase family)